MQRPSSGRRHGAALAEEKEKARRMGGGLTCLRRRQGAFRLWRPLLSLSPLRGLRGFRLRDFLPQETRALAVALKLQGRLVQSLIEGADIPPPRLVGRLAAVRVVDPRRPSGRREGPQDLQKTCGDPQP